MNLEHTIDLDSNPSTEVPQEQPTAALRQEDDLADYSDGEGSDSFVLDEGELGVSGLPPPPLSGQKTVKPTTMKTNSTLAEKNGHVVVTAPTQGEEGDDCEDRGPSVIDWSGSTFVGDLATQLSWLRPEKPPVKFRPGIAHDDYDDDDGYFGFERGGASDYRRDAHVLGYSEYEGWRPGGVGGGWGPGTWEADGSQLQPTVVDVHLPLGKGEDGEEETVPVRVIIRSKDEVILRNLLREQDEEEDKNDDDDDDDDDDEE